MKNILLFSTLFSLLFSAVHRVPHDRETIQDGIDAAASGDTVLVDDGIYFENVVIDKEITLASYFLIDGEDSHMNATIIDGSDYDYLSSSYGSCVLFRSPYSGDLIYPQLIGFTIQNGTGTRVRETIQTPTGEEIITYYMGGGIMADHCAPIVNHNRIRNNGVRFVGTDEQRGPGTQRGGGAGFNNSDNVEFDEDLREGSARFILRDHHDINFSWNEWDNNFADDGNTLGSLDFTGDFDMSNSEFDYFSDEFEDVYDYWVDEGDAFTDFTNSFGDPAIDDSDVFIDGSIGNDTTNTGITPDSPFSTIEGALSKIYGNASNPRNIFMAGGNYSPSRDGAFPVRMTSHISLSGDNVEFDEDRDYTVIDPGGTGRAFLIEDVENVTLSNMKIMGGSAVDNIGFGGLGGGILVHESDPLLKNLIIESNEASIFGGGLCFVISSATLVDMDILNNTAPGGAGIFMYSSDLNMVNVNIQENQGEEGDLDNTPYTVGAGLLMDRSNPLLNGVRVTGNVADYAGGVWLGNSDPIMTNVTIANNTATGHNYFLENYELDVYGGGVGMWNSFPLITNSIVYDNTPDPLVSFFESQPVITFSNVEGGSLDNGNIDLPPLFNEDFSLGESSPCIDSGNPNPIYFDVDDGSVADMGATGGSRLLFNFQEYNFGTVGNIGSSAVWTLFNHTYSPLVISSISFSNDNFQSNSSLPLSINMLEEGNISFQVDPDVTGSISTDIFLESADLSSGSFLTLNAVIEQGILVGVISGALPTNEYRVTGDITVAEETSLNIYAGSKILFDGPYSLTVDGGIIVAQGTSSDTIIFTNFSENSEKWQGIRMLNQSSETIFDFVRISDAEAIAETEIGGGDWVSGGIFMKDSDPVIQNTTITRNTCNTYGGGMWLWDSDPVLSNLTVSDNSAGISGGGLRLRNSSPTMTNVTVKDNQTSTDVVPDCCWGGGILLDDHSSPTMTDIIIEDNIAVFGGGLYLLDNSNPVMTDVSVTENTSLAGGGIYMANSEPNINSVNINSNHAYYSSGGMYLISSDPIMNNVSISDNIVLYGDDYGGGQESAGIPPPWGGGLCLIYSDPTMNGVIVSGNSLVGESINLAGGGMMIYESEPSMNNIIIENNEAPGSGGGIILINSQTNSQNVTITGNFSGNHGGGIYMMEGSNLVFSNFTLSMNEANGIGGVAIVSSLFTITNSIVWDNNAIYNFPDNIGVAGNYSNVITYSDIQGGAPGEGNINQNPNFTDPNNDDFSLQTGSPCIDAGTADIDGDGENDLQFVGLAPDMGSFEYGAVYGCMDPSATNYDPGANMDDGSCEYPAGLYVSYSTGWNIVGLALEVDDSNYQTIFPNAQSGSLYSFNGIYQEQETLALGTGYLLRLTADDPVTFTGTPIDEITISLSSGWNLFSGISSSLSVDEIYVQDIVQGGTIYGLDGLYLSPEFIEPGRGYWVRATEDGEITLSSGGLAKQVSFVNRAEEANSITFSNGTYTTELYFGVEIPEEEVLGYSLPPTFPGLAFDARFSGNTKVVLESGEIEILSNSERLTIEYDIKIEAGESFSWMLRDINGESFVLDGLGEINVPTGERFSLVREPSIPVEYTLHQNFPNPFNPITTLRYDLPSNALVTLSIYDMLGREVTQLVNTFQQSGFKSIKWDATDRSGKQVSAGIYLYRIEAGSFIKSRKMVLLK